MEVAGVVACMAEAAEVVVVSRSGWCVEPALKVVCSYNMQPRGGGGRHSQQQKNWSLGTQGTGEMVPMNLSVLAFYPKFITVQETEL